MLSKVFYVKHILFLSKMVFYNKYVMISFGRIQLGSLHIERITYYTIVYIYTLHTHFLRSFWMRLLVVFFSFLFFFFYVETMKCID